MPVHDAAKRDYRAVLFAAIASLMFGALAFAFVGVPVADAGERGGAEKASHGKKHMKSSKRQLRQLRRMVRSQAAGLEALRGELAALRGQLGAPATPTGAAGGDLTGTYPNPTLADGSIDSTDLFSANLLEGEIGASELGSTRMRESNVHAVPDGSVQGLSLACQPGETLLSGGFDLVDENGNPVSGGADILIPRSRPISAGTWGFRIANFSGGTGTIYHRGSVLCLEP